MKENTNNNNDGAIIKLAQLPNFSNYIIFSDGKIWNIKTQKFIGTSNQSNKYITVAMKDDNGNYHFMSLHKVIYTAFNGDVPSGLQINHISEEKLDNSLENLEVVTPKENCTHGTRNKRISETMKKLIRIKQDFSVVVNGDFENEEYYKSISELTAAYPNETRYIWRYRLYENKKPKKTYLDYSADGKSLMISPLSEQYKNRLEEYEQNKRMSKGE